MYSEVEGAVSIAKLFKAKRKSKSGDRRIAKYTLLEPMTPKWTGVCIKFYFFKRYTLQSLPLVFRVVLNTTCITFWKRVSLDA
jgi:hypothetical protein